VDERVRRAEIRYARAVLTGAASQLAEADRELDAAEADLALARGQLMHARFLLHSDEDPAAAHEDPHELPLFERAVLLYRELGDTGGEAAALFWVGCFHQVVRHDNATAVPVLEQSVKLASQAGNKATLAEALRHLGIAAHRTGRLELAEQHLAESTQLRREIGLLPGAAANMVGLAYIAAARGRTDDALALLDEAGAIARASQADRIAQQVDEARAEISGRHTDGTG
jgi:tetratricopeptide (TPR) repeat protein